MILKLSFLKPFEYSVFKWRFSSRTRRQDRHRCGSRIKNFGFVQSNVTTMHFLRRREKYLFNSLKINKYTEVLILDFN